jgi:membrane-bound acyltransferase YfiQ involved in biofilm formation
MLLVTPFKFATIGFFLISGFLLGERVDRRNPLEYFMRRVRRVFYPWLLWCGIMVASLVIYKLAGAGPGHLNPAETLRIAWSSGRFVLFATSFWFVPNLLLSIAILLIFRRHLYSLKLGLFLLAVNLVYAVNIYTMWFQTMHTRAFFGFVFYLWLGSYAAHNFDKISSFLNRIPVAVLVATSLIMAAAAYGEAHLLSTLHNPYPLNTLRLSNQIFSISMVLLLFKLKRATWPGFTDVRRHTFGLYLTHVVAWLFLAHLLRLCPRWTPGSVYAADAEGVLLWLILAVAVYGTCLMVTIWLANRPSLEWMVGLAPEASPSRSGLNAIDAHALLSSQ